MPADTQEFIAFTKGVLIPRAGDILREKYAAHCAGKDIGMESKSDNSPATQADRETETALRDLITQKYPGHGIWGEEFGAYHTDRDFVWVLDPLDGTKDFIAKNTGAFGTLIGLLHKGVAMIGAVGEPVNNKVWISGEIKSVQKEAKLEDSTVCHAGLKTTMTAAEAETWLQSLQTKARTLKHRGACINFVNILDGTAQGTIEGHACLHDIAPLVPLLREAGATVIDFEGRDYTSTPFDLNKTEDYQSISAVNASLAREILSSYRKK